MHVRLRYPAVRFGAILALAWMGIALEDRTSLGWEPPLARQSAPGMRGEGETARNPAAAPEAKTFYTRYRRFGLPITVLQAPYQIRSVQLHVSVDGGTTWRTYAEEPATRNEFIFEAPSDGQYWFASKTVDVQNAVRPTGRTQAEQHVVIDTQKPQFELRADVTAHGTIRLAWRVADPNLDPRSFLIEYQAPPREDWTPIELPSELLAAERGVMAGEFEWKPTVSSRVVFLGSRVKDRAGNVAVQSTRVFLPRVAARANMPPREEEGVARSTASPGDVGGELTPETYALHGNSSGSRGAGERSSDAVSWPEKTQGWTSNSTAKPGAEPDASYAPSGEVLAAAEPGEGREQNERVDTGEGLPGSGPGRMVADRAAARSSDGDLSEPSALVTGDVRPQVAAQVPAPAASTSSSPSNASESDLATRDAPAGASSEPADPAATGSASERDVWPEIPAGESLRMTHSRRFFLEYDIESAGPEGVAEVELWATQDGGRSWEKWGIDADKQSPLDVQVDEEGVYGFRVVVVGKNGLAAPAPDSGDAADLWVGVDITPPQAEITAVTYGTGARIGDLDIRWIASDRRLAARPITLAFSASREGPWTTIASGLPNSGQYFWKVDASIPKQVYLRIQCQDEAGNATEFTIREPINTERLSPKGRIRGFRPAEEEEAAKKSAFFWFPWR